MRRGFTLIELLAVIVILAIIALIATPIVIHIINDSKKESINRSIELYIDHAQKMVAKEQMKDPTFNPSKCEINEGNLTCDGKTIQIEMKGQTPKSGTIKFSKGMVIEGVNLELDNLYYQVTGDNISEGKKEKSYSNYITKVSNVDSDGKVSPGDEYTYQVNSNDTFTFHVLSVEGDKVNLIMNKNICKDGTTDYANDQDNNYCRYAWHEEANNNNYGPDTAMTNLYNATKSWTNVPDMIMEYIDENNSGTNYGYTGITTDINTKVTTITGKNGAPNTTIGTTELPLKARIPKESEIMGAGCGTGVGSCPTWLVENLIYWNGANNKYSMNDGNGISIYGYWLFSSYPGSSDIARSVGYDGRVNYGGITSYAISYGVRAVITVSMSDLSN